MKLKKFLNKLNKIAKENPVVLDYDVITASDDEGNSYHQVHFDPSVGILVDGEDYESNTGEDQFSQTAEVICIN